MSFFSRFRFDQRRRDLAQEIEAHLAIAIRERIERGESPAEAERNARREFGNQLLVREVTRDMWGWIAVEQFLRDLRHGARQFARTPGFTAVAMATLALGLGATLAMFAIVEGVLLRPLDFRQPEHLYLARSVAPPEAKLTGNFPVNGRHFDRWRAACRACESLALFSYQEMTLVGSGEPLKLPAYAVTHEFFDTLGVKPFLGRSFLPEEDRSGGAGVVLLTHRLWRTRFNSDPAIVGRTLQLNGEAWIVAGVLPDNLHLPKGEEWGSFFGPPEEPLIFRPLGQNLAAGRPVGNLNYSAIIRLKTGVSRAVAEQELNALLADFVTDFHLATRTVLIPLLDQITRGARSSLWLLLAGISTVLLIVCVNIGNLMVVRTAGRYREAAIRVALGATRRRLFAQVLEEALLLVSVGGLLAGIVCWTALRLFRSLAPEGVPRLHDIRLDGTVLLVGFATIGLCTLLCGLLPAWRLSRSASQQSLKAGASTNLETVGRVELRQILVAVEVALSTVLLTLAGLLLFSFVRLMEVPKGFETAHIITQDVSYLSPKYAHGARRDAAAETVRRLAEIPGVQVAAGTNVLPLRGDDWISELEDPDAAAPPPGDQVLANSRFVTSGYWQAMGIPLLAGRYLDESDRDRPRAVVSESVARYLWPGRSALGHHVRGAGSGANSLEVVGVVGEVRAGGLEKNPTPIVYEHFWRMQPIGMSFLVRTTADPAGSATAMRNVLRSLDPEMALPPLRGMQQIVDASVAGRRFQMHLALGFALAALLLASLGIYGMTSFTVARRTPELGIRIALGAEPGQLLRMILAHGLRPVVLGFLLGGTLAVWIASYIRHQFFGVVAWDPTTLAIVAGVLLGVALLACLVPALRAFRTDPLVALRFE